MFAFHLNWKFTIQFSTQYIQCIQFIRIECVLSTISAWTEFREEMKWNQMQFCWFIDVSCSICLFIYLLERIDKKKIQRTYCSFWHYLSFLLLIFWYSFLIYIVEWEKQNHIDYKGEKYSEWSDKLSSIIISIEITWNNFLFHIETTTTLVYAPFLFINKYHRIIRFEGKASTWSEHHYN